MNDVAFFLCFVMFIAAAVMVPWAIRADRADAHLLHKPGTCNECDGDEQ